MHRDEPNAYNLLCQGVQFEDDDDVEWNRPLSDEELQAAIAWQIGPGPAAIRGGDLKRRLHHYNMPEKFEVYDGKLFYDDRQRLHILGMLLESMGTDAVYDSLGLR